MSEESATPSRPGVVPVERMRPIDRGMSMADVIALAGEPLSRQTSGDIAPWLEQFHDLGIHIFDFIVHDDYDELWIYEHDRRGKFKMVDRLVTCVQFKDNAVVSIWREQGQRGG